MSGDNKENKSMFSFFGSKSEDPDLNIPGRLLIHVLIIKFAIVMLFRDVLNALEVYFPHVLVIYLCSVAR